MADAEVDPEGGGDADRGCAADDEALDGVPHLLLVGDVDVDGLEGELGLVEQGRAAPVQEMVSSMGGLWGDASRTANGRAHRLGGWPSGRHERLSHLSKGENCRASAVDGDWRDRAGGGLRGGGVERSSSAEFVVLAARASVAWGIMPKSSVPKTLGRRRGGVMGLGPWPRSGKLG